MKIQGFFFVCRKKISRTSFPVRQSFPANFRLCRKKSPTSLPLFFFDKTFSFSGKIFGISFCLQKSFSFAQNFPANSLLCGKIFFFPFFFDKNFSSFFPLMTIFPLFFLRRQNFPVFSFLFIFLFFHFPFSWPHEFFRLDFRFFKI